MDVFKARAEMVAQKLRDEIKNDPNAIESQFDEDKLIFLESLDLLRTASLLCH